MNKLKQYSTLIWGVITLILGALLFRQKRVADNLQSGLAKSEMKNKTQEVDHERNVAKKEADGRVTDYEQLKREYDKSRGSSDV